MKYLFILVIAAVVAVGGYLALRPDSTNGPAPSPSPSVSAAARSSPVPTRTTTPRPSPAVSPSPAAAPTPPAQAQVHQVSIQDFKFGPASLTANRGDTVVFTNRDGVVHTVTSLMGAFESGSLSKDQSWTLSTATLAPGAYDYKCTPHPFMKGTLIIK